jgi:hypothetical protein
VSWIEFAGNFSRIFLQSPFNMRFSYPSIINVMRLSSSWRQYSPYLKIIHCIINKIDWIPTRIRTSYYLGFQRDNIARVQTRRAQRTIISRIGFLVNV